MERVEGESFGSTVQVLQAEVVGFDEVVEMPAELVVRFIVEALDGRFLERPVHAFDLAVIRHDGLVL